jgi:methionyl-tRNA synthetase
MDRRLITSALPYVNNIPHLGNLIQVLSADVFARYCRMNDYDTLYICATDEYGTATETRALEEGVSPQELCDRYHKIHADIYRWFNIAFDRFGRTSTPNHTKITQDIFLKLDRNGFIQERTIQQLYCEKDSMFLADRYVRGTCPHCGYEEARGDQCENCGKLLDPTELVEARCGICGTAPVVKESDHLYIDLPAILPRLKQWMGRVKQEGHWAKNAVQMTQAWIRDGLRERGITRDLKWGIPVPKSGYEEKVFYVWFDAPIGYISVTANHTEEWQSWWKNPGNVRLFQFMGKDNIPFHTVIFPSSLLGSGDSWTLLHHMSSTEYLNYEGGKFSKSKGIGVFGTDVMETGIPSDVWRFYIYYNRPERSDALFTWKDFQEKVNGELIGNLSNLVNRTLSFVSRYFDGGISEDGDDPEFWSQITTAEEEITQGMERVELRDSLRKIFLLSSKGNKYFQDAEPWRSIKDDRQKTARVLRNLVYLVKDLAILIHPYLPDTSKRIGAFIGMQEPSWSDLGKREGIRSVSRPKLLFRPIDDKTIDTLRRRFSGGREETKGQADRFSVLVDLRVARIEKVERHPKADTLFIETVDVGGEKRQIVSGLVHHYKENELEGRNIILAYNLKAAKLRGVESQGMLLAAEKGDLVEVVFADHASPGDRLILDKAGGSRVEGAPPSREITIEEFFEVPISVRDHILYVENQLLTVGGKKLTVERVDNGKVG